MKILGICSLLLLAKSNAESTPRPSTTTTPNTTLEGTNNPTMGTRTTTMGTASTTMDTRTTTMGTASTTMDTRTTTMGTANTTMGPEVTTVNSTVTNATTTPQTTPGNGGSVLTASLLFPLVSAVLWVL
ncbi:nucleoporin NSP1-like isoform X1 [Takifugu rubripes]|uniref:nucleoporin NSP1-like isoform X1 n=1 Tax=Takifugu rubripes TaxID=31033 RepID=UPI0011452034|nr:nucleoporin NSP1-like isoform X1 [Takifugu rubripes]